MHPAIHSMGVQSDTAMKSTLGGWGTQRPTRRSGITEASENIDWLRQRVYQVISAYTRLTEEAINQPKLPP